MSWNFWDKIYLINLDERTDRLKETLLEFKKARLNSFQRVSGLRYLNNGNAGCYMTHLSILEDAIQKKYEKILILEDDVKFLSAGLANLAKSQKQVAKLNWDAYFVGLRASGNILQISSELGLVLWATMTHAIGYHRRAFAKILAELKATLPRPGHMRAIDQAGIFSNFLGFNVFCLCPLGAIQRKSKSDIQPDDLTDHEQDCLDDYKKNLILNDKKVGKWRILGEIKVLIIDFKKEKAEDLQGKSYRFNFTEPEIILYGQSYKKQRPGYYENRDGSSLEIFYV